MSSPSDRNWQAKLEEMEAEINRVVHPNAQQSTTEKTRPRIEINPSPQVREWINSAKTWFNNLPQVGKVAVGIGAIWFSFSVLNAFLHIVSSLISIVLMGFILYLGYKFVVNAKN
jgi:hypothetical protein